mgnify:CR=1 FL=1
MKNTKKPATGRAGKGFKKSSTKRAEKGFNEETTDDLNRLKRKLRAQERENNQLKKEIEDLKDQLIEGKSEKKNNNDDDGSGSSSQDETLSPV